MRVMALAAVLLFVLVGIMWALPGWPRRVARVITLVVLSLALLATLVVGETALVVNRTLLNPSFHTAAIEEAGLAAALPAAVTGMLAGKFDEAGLKAGQRQEMLRLVEDCVGRALSPEWVKRQVHTLLGQLISYLRGRTPALEFSVDLREPKAAALEFLSGARADRRVIAGLKNLVSAAPDQVSAASVPGFPGIEEALGPWRPAVRALWLAPLGGGLLALVLALLVWLACGRRRAAAAWMGATMLLAGIAATGAAVLGKSRATEQLGELALPPPLSALPVSRWLEAEATGILDLEGLMGLVTLAAAAVLLIVPFLLPRRRPSAPAREAAPPG